MTVSIWQSDDTQPFLEVDFLVVGAGLVGCAAAYFAAQAGRAVTITEMRDVGLGASSRNAGFMITGLDTYYHTAIARYGHTAARELWRISEQTQRFWREIAAAGAVRMMDCGSMLLAESAAEAKELEHAARALDADGIAIDYSVGDPLGRGYFAAIRQPHDSAVQPYELAQAVLRQSGATLIANNEIYGIRSLGNEAVLVASRQYRFKARTVLLCTNASSVQLDSYFVDKVIPTRAQCLVTTPLPSTPILGTCGYSDYGYMYYRDTFDGRLLIGGGRKQNKAAEHDTTDDRVTASVQGVLDAYLREHFPDVTAPIDRRWAGIMAFTPDGLPLVGKLPDQPRVGFCIACNGHGLAMGAGSAARAVDLLINGTDPGVIDAARLH